MKRRTATTIEVFTAVVLLPHRVFPHQGPYLSAIGGHLTPYDMSGNVFEWCQDTCADDITAVPQDGTPYLGPGTDRRLRGGSHQNWDLHCRVWWRFGIAPDAHDGCLGFRPGRTR